MEHTPTTEEITRHITNAYDSVSLITDLDAKPQPLSVDDAATRERNVEHIKIMMAKDWFFLGLTAEQKTQINALIIKIHDKK